MEGEARSTPLQFRADITSTAGSKNGPGKTEKASIVDKLAVREGVNVLEVREGVDKLAVREGMDNLAVREGMCVNKLDVRERVINVGCKYGPGKTEKAATVDKLTVREGVTRLEVRESMNKLAVREGVFVDKLDVRERSLKTANMRERSLKSANMISMIDGEHKMGNLDVMEGVSRKRVREGVAMDKLYVMEHGVENIVKHDRQAECTFEHGISRKMGVQVQNMIRKLQSSPTSNWSTAAGHGSCPLSGSGGLGQEEAEEAVAVGLGQEEAQEVAAGLGQEVTEEVAAGLGQDEEVAAAGLGQEEAEEAAAGLGQEEAEEAAAGLCQDKAEGAAAGLCQDWAEGAAAGLGQGGGQKKQQLAYMMMPWQVLMPEHFLD